MKQYTAQDLDLKVAPEALKPLFKTQSHRHALAMVADWLVILASIYCCIQFFNPLTYFLTVVIIGAKMHGLAILMHDAAHYRFLKNRKWNDLLTNVFIVYPLFVSLGDYRQNHMRHHRHLNTEDDPDWVAKLGKRAFTFPKTKREFIATVLSYLVLYQGVKDALWFLNRFQVPTEASGNKVESKTGKLIFTAILFTSLTVLGWWKYYLLFWIIPYFSTFFMFQYIRSVAEHFGELAYDHLLNSTRSVKATPLERFFIAPHNVGYHLEHHLYPGVPFYNLPKLQELWLNIQKMRRRTTRTHNNLIN